MQLPYLKSHFSHYKYVLQLERSFTENPSTRPNSLNPFSQRILLPGLLTRVPKKQKAERAPVMHVLSLGRQLCSLNILTIINAVLF